MGLLFIGIPVYIQDARTCQALTNRDPAFLGDDVIGEVVGEVM